MPDNVLDLVDQRMLSMGQYINFDNSTSSSAAISYSALVSADLKSRVDSTSGLSINMCPFDIEDMDYYNPEKYTYKDWCLFGISCRQFVSSPIITEQSDGDFLFVWSLDGNLEKITYRFVNEFCVGIPTLHDHRGELMSYKYGIFDSGNYRTNACSLGYLAAHVLNEYALGQGSYTAEQVELCKTYVNWSVDLANGLTEPTDDDSTYTVIDYPPSISLNVGKTYRVNVKIAEDLRVPVAYKSLDESVATVSETGEIKAVSAGNTIIAVYVAGVPYSVSVTVV